MARKEKELGEIHSHKHPLEDDTTLISPQIHLKWHQISFHVFFDDLNLIADFGFSHFYKSWPHLVSC